LVDIINIVLPLLVGFGQRTFFNFGRGGVILRSSPPKFTFGGGGGGIFHLIPISTF
jgi:hypothetical protein